jgi:hypothetical protein
MAWVLGILVVAIIVAVVYALTQRPEKAKSAELRRRYALDTSEAVQIPLVEERPPAPVTPIAETNGTFIFADERTTERTVTSNWLGDLVRDESAAGPMFAPERPAVGGRIVQTPDGETVITTPPFALRPQMLSNRLGRYANGLGKRLPAWLIACPRVRLESLVTPTPPDGRDAADWSQWRKRVRVRAVDVVICDRRTWRPVLAIMLKPASRFTRKGGTNGTVTAMTIGGGEDRMIDEVLGHVGLTLIHGSGKIADDWPMIEPYLEQAILRTPSEDELMLATEDSQSRLDPDAAVKLLRMDDDKGWLLE